VAIFAERDARDHGVVADFAAVFQGVGDVRDQGGGLGADRHLLRQQHVVGLDVRVVDGPVGANAVAGVDLEVGGVKTRGERGPVNGAAAYAFAAVVAAEGERVFTAGDAEVVPVKLARACFVGNPVALGVPERTRLEAAYVKPARARRCNSTPPAEPTPTMAKSISFSSWKRRRGDGDLLHGTEPVVPAQDAAHMVSRADDAVEHGCCGGYRQQGVGYSPAGQRKPRRASEQWGDQDG